MAKSAFDKMYRTCYWNAWSKDEPRCEKDRVWTINFNGCGVWFCSEHFQKHMATTVSIDSIESIERHFDLPVVDTPDSD